MKSFLFACLIIVFALSAPSFAAEEFTEEKTSDTRIELDEEGGIIRFVIKGVEQARLTQDGLAVRNRVSFGGTIADIGDKYDDVQDKDETNDE